jgi:diacylglycerol kinase (ATP)
MAGVGFDASVVHELGRIRSGPIDITNYVLPAVKAVAEYRFSKLTVTVDGKRVFDDGPAMAFVGNIPEYGTGFPILPLAKADDQLLDVCVMPCSTRRRLLELALAVASGDHLRQEDVVYLKGTSVRVESPDAVPVQVDGEPAGTTPLHIDLLPGRIPFIVPPRE